MSKDFEIPEAFGAGDFEYDTEDIIRAVVNYIAILLLLIGIPAAIVLWAILT